MSEFILGSLPILVMWALPLAPMLYGVIADIAQAFGGGSRTTDVRQSTNAGTAVLQTRAAVRGQATSSAGDQQAA